MHHLFFVTSQSWWWNRVFKIAHCKIVFLQCDQNSSILWKKNCLTWQGKKWRLCWGLRRASASEAPSANLNDSTNLQASLGRRRRSLLHSSNRLRFIKAQYFFYCLLGKIKRLEFVCSRASNRRESFRSPLLAGSLVHFAKKMTSLIVLFPEVIWQITMQPSIL